MEVTGGRLAGHLQYVQTGMGATNMQRTEHSAFAVLRQIARHAAWVLVVSMFLIACGTGSQDSGSNAVTTTPEIAEVRSTPELDIRTSPSASPSAVETRAGHEYMTPATATATATETTAPSSHYGSAATATTVTDSAGAAEVQILDFAFDPPLLEVKAGTAVTFINQGVDHTATALDDPSVFDTGILHTGESFSVTFDTAGTYDYWCLLHPNMVGAIVVK